MHLCDLKNKARNLRKRGLSLLSIAKDLGIAKSTASLWVRDVTLPDSAKLILKNSSDNAINKALDVLRKKRDAQNFYNKEEADKILKKSFNFSDPNFWKLCAALAFWCEGSKSSLSDLRFTNSDPVLIRLFLHSIRTSFSLNEEKFRALVHLHDYHEEREELKFWSKITNIPVSQFHKFYRKPNTKIRQRDGYHGCISIRYADAAIAKKLSALYHQLAQIIGP